MDAHADANRVPPGPATGGRSLSDPQWRNLLDDTTNALGINQSTNRRINRILATSAYAQKARALAEARLAEGHLRPALVNAAKAAKWQASCQDDPKSGLHSILFIWSPGIFEELDEGYRRNAALIEEFEPVKAPRWASQNWVPTALWRDRRLSKTSVRLYGLLLSHSDNRTKCVYRSLDRMAEDLGLKGRDRAKNMPRHLRPLLNHGYLVLLQQGRRHRASRYQVIIGEMTLAVDHDYGQEGIPLAGCGNSWADG